MHTFGRQRHAAGRGRRPRGSAAVSHRACLCILTAALFRASPAAERPTVIAIDYPEEGAIFPPDMSAPTFLWRDPSPNARHWRVEVTFADGSAPIRRESPGAHLRIGEIDKRCIAATNQLPKLTPQQAAERTWVPDAATWDGIKSRSASHNVKVTVAGFTAADPAHAVSLGTVNIQTSRDPVGAPIFYRDVPLMPSELEKGVIKPLAASAVPLIAWRLRNVGETRSRLLMEGLHTCANCHSFSSDGRTLGMDLDGPQNDKGMYTLASVKPQMSIGREDVIEWRSFKGKLTGDLRIGFMSRVSPDGRYVVTTIKGPDPEGRPPQREYVNNYYVANFKDYRFLQVFYATRGILAWYSKSTGRLEPLAGADDQNYVQTGAVWSPDGKYLVFARAAARDAYSPQGKPAEYANDPNETPIQYDLYRIPFNDGKGGVAERIEGASRNGKSNSFPKISPDGKWIVYVQSRNGLLMRPDSRLYIVPSAGGEARALRSNTPLMNSWHSFSPNGRWLVFSSKSRSPYTQMYLTHLDEEGNASPAILIENATAANRAVNIPEFVNIPPDGLLKIDTPAVEFYKVFDTALDLSNKGQYEAAISQWKSALELAPEDARARTSFGITLVRAGRLPDSIAEFEKALAVNPDYLEAHNNLGIALAASGKPDQAIAHFRRALEINPDSPDAHHNLGFALAGRRQYDEAIAHFRRYLELKPGSAEVESNLALALSAQGKVGEAVEHFRKAAELTPGSAEAQADLSLALAGAGKPAEAVAHFEKALALNAALPEAQDPATLDTIADAYAETGRFAEAVATTRRALALAMEKGQVSSGERLRKKLALYESRKARVN